jgi:hypothetical protein
VTSENLISRHLKPPGQNSRISPRLRARLTSETAVVVALVFVGLALRVSRLHTATLWRDDAWVALTARVPLPTAVQFGATAPGFMAFVHWWEGVAGHGRALRVPGTFVGAAAAPVVYLAARWCGTRRLSAVVAGLTVACSTIAVNQSEHLKEFSYDLLAAAGCLLVGLWLARRGTAGRAALAAIALILMTVVSGAVLPAAIGSYALACVALDGDTARWQRPTRAVIWSAAGYGAFLLVWYAAVLSHIPAALNRYWLPTMPGRHLSGVGRLARNVGGVVHGLIPLPEVLTVAIALVAAGLLVANAARRPLVLSLLVPIALAILADIAHRAPLGDGRTDTFLYPSLALLFGLALDRALVVFPGRAVPIAAYALLLAMPIYAVTALRGYPRTAIVPLSDQAHMQPGDRFIISGGARYPYVFYEVPDAHLTIDHGVQSNIDVRVPPGPLRVIDREPPDDGYIPNQAAQEARGARRVWFLGTIPYAQDRAAVNSGSITNAGWDAIQEHSLASAGWHLQRRTWLGDDYLSLWVPGNT